MPALFSPVLYDVGQCRLQCCIVDFFSFDGWGDVFFRDGDGLDLGGEPGDVLVGQGDTEDHAGQSVKGFGAARGEDLICIKCDDIDRIQDDGVGAAAGEACDIAIFIGQFPFDGAERITFFAPASRCNCAEAASEK